MRVGALTLAAPYSQLVRGLLWPCLHPILVLILLGAGGAPATEQRALALELVALVQPESSYRSGMEQMTDQMLPQLDAQARASGHPLPTDFKPRFIAVLLEVVPTRRRSSGPRRFTPNASPSPS